MAPMSPYPDDPTPDAAEPNFPPGGDMTVDLSLEGEEDAFDLQALADQVAEETKEPPPPLAKLDPEVLPDVSARIIEELERTLEEATARIKDVEQREREHLEKHQRLLADFANYRNRTQREIQMGVDMAEKRLLLELLPILDSQDRCLNASYSSVEAFHEGVALIHKQYLDALRRVGAEPVALEIGDPFDAQHAEALTTISNPELPDGAITAIYERGFRLRDNLLRPARVVVNHFDHPEPSTDHQAPETGPGEIQ